MEKDIKKLTEELLKLMGIDGSVEVSTSPSTEKDEEDSYYVVVDSEKESGLLIGAHGRTLSAIQSFLTIAMRQKTGEWQRILLDIGDWRQKHEEYLVGLAKQAAERARTTETPQNLYNLTPAQRRIVHMALQEEDGIETESEGEGEGRYLVVTAK